MKHTGLLKGVLGSIGVRSLGMGSSVLVSIVVARALGPEQFGVFAFVMAAVYLLCVPTQFGMAELVLRETALGMAEGKFSEVSALWRTALLFCLCLAALMALVAVALYTLAGLGHDVPPSAAMLGLAIFPILSLSNVRGAALKGIGRVIEGQLPDFLIQPTSMLVLSCVLYVVLDGSFGAMEALWLQLAAAVIAFAIGFVLLLRAAPAMTIKAKAPPVWSLARKAMPLAILAGVSTLNQQVDILMLGLMAPVEDAGLYRVALQGSILVGFGLLAVISAVAQQIAHSHAVKDHERLQDLATWSARFTFVVALIPALGVVFFGRPLIGLVFGPSFLHAYEPLVLLSAGQVFSAAFGAVAIMLAMTGHERVSACALAAVVGLKVLINATLIPALGAEGAATGTLVCTVIQFILLGTLAVRILGIDPTILGLRLRRAP